MRFFVRIRTKEQMEALAEVCSSLKLQNEQLYIICPVNSGRDLAAKVNGQNTGLFADLPDIARENRSEELLQAVRSADWACGMVIKNVDELGMLKSTDYKGIVIADPFLYAYNSEAATFYMETFPDMLFISSDELTDSELEKLPFKDRIIYKAYGRQRVMFSAQSLKSNFKEGSSTGLRLESGKGDSFIALDEEYGYSSILTADPVSMLEGTDSLKWDKVMIDLTTEDAKATKEILKDLSCVGRYLKGHHLKGID